MSANHRTVLPGIAAALFLAGKLSGGTIDVPTPVPLPTQVQPQLNVAIDKSTEEITFINTNNDPYVYTRVYKLKHADPYEIRPYLMAAIRSRRIDTNETKVEAIKYADGTGMVIVSAEQYRFEKLDNGMTIDQVVEMLDRPDLSAQAGRRFFVYYAKYFDATTLAKLIEQVGIMRADDSLELDGVDTVRADNGMNALVFFCTPISQKNIEAVLAQYDCPSGEALFHYTIYEIDSENDGNLGVDFQAWKNGPGLDLFAAGATYLNGWDPLIGTIGNATEMVKDAHVNYINFNPKWNSKYLDFLVSKSKAKVLTSGTLDVWNKAVGTIESVTRFPIIGDGEEEIAETATENSEITITVPGQPEPLILTANKPGETTVTTVKNSKLRKSSNAEFGFRMSLLPEVYGKSTIVRVSMENTNLLGFHSDGTPRTSKTELETTLQVSNEGSVFYIGGLEKSDLVRSVNKVPFLGDLPGLGWIFSGESEIVKKSRIVAVLTIQPVIPTTRVTGEQTKFMKDTRERIDNFGLKSIDENEYGFDQLLVDPERRRTGASRKNAGPQNCWPAFFSLLRRNRVAGRVVSGIHSAGSPEIESGEFDARTISAAACPVARSRTLAYHTFRRPNQHSTPGTGQSTVATFASRPPPHVSLPAATLFSLVEAVTASTAAQPPVSATISAIAAGTAATRKLFRSRNSSFLPLFQFATGRKYPHTRL